MNEILLLHDDREGHESRRNTLEVAGYRVTSFQRSAECLRQIEERQPILVLLDVLLHGINGFELCREIRKEYTAQELPVILSSELYRGEAFVQEAKDAGAQAYLIRPMPHQMLLDQVTRLTRSRGSAAAGTDAA